MYRIPLLLLCIATATVRSFDRNEGKPPPSQAGTQTLIEGEPTNADPKNRTKGEHTKEVPQTRYERDTFSHDNDARGSCFLSVGFEKRGGQLLLSVETPIRCKDYCLLIKSCFSFAYNLLNETCSLFDEPLGDSIFDLDFSNGTILWGDTLCFLRPEIAILSLDQVIEETSPILISYDCACDYMCLNVERDGDGLKWDKCSSSEDWLISRPADNGSDGFVQVALARDPSLCIHRVNTDYKDISYTRLSACNANLTNTSATQMLKATYIPEPYLPVPQYNVYMIYDPDNSNFNILFLSEVYSGEPGLDSVIFLDPPTKPRVCRLRDIRALNGKPQNKQNLPFFLEGHIVTIKCKEGYGVQNGSYIFPTQSVKCEGGVTEAEPCVRLNERSSEGYCDLYLALAVGFALFVVVLSFFLTVLTVQQRKLTRVVAAD